MTSGEEYREIEDDGEQAPQITEEKIEDGSGRSSLVFPSLQGSAAPELSASPDSNATISSALTSSDKLSALPPSMTSPNLNNRTGRSPVINNHGSPRAFRHSFDASRSWPTISQSGNNIESLAGLSPALPEATGTWSRPRASTSEGSLNHDTPRRTSTESDRGSLPTIQSVRQAFHRLHRGSDPTTPSPALRADYTVKQDVGSRSRSHSHSRATSPLRILQQWSQSIHHRPHGAHQEEPFVPVDPFKSQFRFTFNVPNWYRRMRGKASDDEGLPMKAHDASRPLPTVNRTADNDNNATGRVNEPGHVHQTMGLQIFLCDTLPRLIYLHILLRIPSLYFSRVARIFEDAEVSKPDIQRMIEACGRDGSHIMGQAPLGPGPANDSTNGYTHKQQNVNNTMNTLAVPNNTNNTWSPSAAPATNLAAVSMIDLPLPLPLPDEWSSPLVSPSLVRFKISWEAFIDSLMREWKTLNVVSALLLSAILTMFQIDNAASDPVTRTAAFLSLICAIMSLSYGCIYIVRFGTMRSMYRASIWAEEAQKTSCLVWWNVWVLLAMPAVWMSWSMICFIVSVMSFVWRTGDESDPPERSPLGDVAILGPRIAVTFTFLLGMMYFFLIVRTLQSYGSTVFGRERARARFNAQRRDAAWRYGNERERERDRDIHGAGTGRRSSTDGQIQTQTGMGDRTKELRSQPTTMDVQRTPDRGVRQHTADVVVDIMRGRERDRDRERNRNLVSSRRSTPDERDKRQAPQRRTLVGLGLFGGGAQSDGDLEKGGPFDGDFL